jgi:hypothetical protein
MSRFMLRKQKEGENRSAKARTRETTGADRPASPVEITPESAHERIAKRAYELYVAGGYRDGRALDDWLVAERELRSEEPSL